MAIPGFMSQEVYDAHDIILVGKIISKNATFSPTHNLYELKVEKYLKNPQPFDTVSAAGYNTSIAHLGNMVFDVGDRGLFFLNNYTQIYDSHQSPLFISPWSMLIPQEWDDCHVFDNEIPRDHWFLGGTGVVPKISQADETDPEKFLKDKEVTITYDVSNLTPKKQEFDLEGITTISRNSSSEKISSSTQHVILEPCTLYKTMIWRFAPGMVGNYNFEINDPHQGSTFGLGFIINEKSSELEPTKDIIITDVELSSANGTQWIEVYNPTPTEISLATMHINSSDGNGWTSLGGLSGLQSKHYMMIDLQSAGKIDWSNTNNTITIYPYPPDTIVEGGNTNPILWDKTPIQSDSYSDSRTWQLNGTEWVFAEETPNRAIPEFPIIGLILVASMVTILIITRTKLNRS